MCMRIIIRVTKICGKLLSNYIYFSGIYFIGVKTSDEVISEGLYYCRPLNIIHNGFCLATVKTLMKEWPGKYYFLLRVIQEFLVIDHSWPLDKSRTLVMT